MTEQEAIKVFNTVLLLGKCELPADEANEAIKLSIKALEEIQQYREIGTVEECRAAVEKQIPKKPIIHTNDIDRLACCPVCDSNVDWTYEGFWRKGNPKYCRECGQAIDWSD